MNRKLLALTVALLALALGLTPALALAAETRTVVDETGRSVVVPAQPQRIVALTPWVVEMLWMLGKPPVGRPSSADWPREVVGKIPEHGLSYRLNFERIAAMKPDLVIGNKDLHASQLTGLAQVGAPTLLYMIDSYKDVIGKFQVLGELVGAQTKADQIVSEMSRRVEALTKKVPATGHPKVLVIVGGIEAWSAAKPNSYLGEMVAQLGGVNIAQGPEHRPGYTKISMERVVEANPDVIIITKPVRDASDTSKALPGFQKDPLWSAIKAVKDGRVMELDPFYFTSPGPRYADALEKIAPELYPGVFGSGR